jgi:hypothetical protein
VHRLLCEADLLVQRLLALLLSSIGSPADPTAAGSAFRADVEVQRSACTCVFHQQTLVMWLVQLLFQSGDIAHNDLHSKVAILQQLANRTLSELHQGRDVERFKEGQ